MFLRRSTNSALEAASTAQRRPTLPSQASKGPVQDTFTAYDDFPWSKIEEYLVWKWPSWMDFNPKRINDKWEFEIPEKLSDADKLELRRRRDAQKRTRREAHSPERGSQGG